MKNLCYSESRHQNPLFGKKIFKSPNGDEEKKGKEKEGQRVKG
jgi:hypothetical protein